MRVHPGRRAAALGLGTDAACPVLVPSWALSGWHPCLLQLLKGLSVCLWPHLSSRALVFPRLDKSPRGLCWHRAGS